MSTTTTKFTDTFSEEIFNQTYSYKGETVDQTHERVARALASVEKPENQEKYTQEFKNILADFKFVPGGRILSNAGTGIRGTSLINCFTPDARVLTIKGYKRISDVCIGDTVLTHTGHWRKVNGTMVKHYIGKLNTYVIPNAYSKHSTKIHCTPNHRFYDAMDDLWVESHKNNQLSRAFGNDSVNGKYNFVETLEYTDKKRYHTGQTRQYFDMGSTSQVDPNIKVLDIASRFIGEYDRTYRHYDHGVVENTGVNVSVTSPSEDMLYFLPSTEIAVEMAQVYTEASEGKEFNHVCNNPNVNQAVRQVAYAELLRGRLPSFIWGCCQSIQQAFVNEFGPPTEYLECMPRNVCDELAVLRTVATTTKENSRVEYDFEKYTDIDYDGLVYNLSVKDDNSYVVHGVIVKNCFVSGAHGYDIDSMDGILDELRRQAHILKSEGGYGFCADFMRPRGAFIEGIAGEGPGAVKMAEMWDTQSSVITSGSGQKAKNPNAKGKIRKGAQMITMSAWHPDIEEFITAKQTPGRLTKFNMSVLVSDSFIHAVKNHLPWNLEFPDIHANKETYKAEWTGDLGKWKEAGHPVHVYKTFEDANKLWDLIMESTYNRNEPGVLFVDTMNKRNNLSYVEHINATNPCLTGDTMILTDQGYFPITELVGRQFNAVVGNKTYTSTPEGFWSTGVKPVYEIELENGITVRATGNHKFRAVKKTIEYRDVFMWEEVEKLQVGECLLMSVSSKYPIGDGDDDNEEYRLGFEAGVSMNPGLLGYLANLLRGQPKIAENRPFEFALGALSGIFSTLGKFKDQTITLEHNDTSVLHTIQRMLLWAGVMSTIQSEPSSGRLEIQGLDCIAFSNARIEIRDPVRRQALIDLVNNFKYFNKFQKEHSKILSITPIGEEEVFDCTIPEVHCFSANGILSHNCGECFATKSSQL